MTPPFLVRTTPHYERLARKLLRQHPDFSPIQERAIAILGADPMNRTRNYHTKQLQGLEDEVTGAVGPGRFEREQDATVVGEAEAVLGHRRAQQVAAELLRSAIAA